MIDSGANGGVFGEDMMIVEECDDQIMNVVGVGAQEIRDPLLAVGAGHVETNEGPVIAIMSQCANCGKGPTIHSKAQLSHFGDVVHDESRKTGGEQVVITVDGYVIPIEIRDGLARVDMRKPTSRRV